MASYRQRGRTWTVYWRVEELVDHPDKGKVYRPIQKSKGGFRTQRDAEHWFIRMEARRLSGQQAVDERMTVSDYMNLYLDSRPRGKPSAATVEQYRLLTRLYITPFLGNIAVSRLDSFMVQRWHNDLLNLPISARSINPVHALLSSALNALVLNGMLPRNPCKLATPPRPEPVERTRLDEDQIRRLLETAESHPLGLMVKTAIFSLMRPGELIALRWEDISWQRAAIHVHRTRRKGPDGSVILGEGAKTRAGNRTVVVHDELMHELRSHRNEQLKSRLANAEVWHDLDLVFCRDNGRPISYTTLNTQLTRMCKDAGVSRVTPHELRHSGASLMVDLNEHLKVISERLGHASIAQTADVYLGVSEGMQRQAAHRLARALERPA